MTTLHDFGGVLGWPSDTFIGLSQFHGHGSWLVSEVELRRKTQQASREGHSTMYKKPGILNQ